MPYSSSMLPGLHLRTSVNVLNWTFSLLLVAFRVAHAQGSTTCRSPDLQAALLQHTTQLQRHGADGPQTAVQEAFPSTPLLDHDGWKWWEQEHRMMWNGSVDQLQGNGAVSGQALSTPVSTFFESARPTDRAITFVTVQDPLFKTNLGSSSLWLHRQSLPHQWLLLNNSQNVGICSLYAQAQKMARHPLLVFVHPDVILPENWYANFMSKLEMIEAVDPNWGVLGTAGVALDWAPPVPGDAKISSSISDFYTHYNTGIDNLQVQSLDEHLLVLRTGSPSFDPNLPGFDLYGTDIVLSARQAGMKSYLLNTPLFHKTVDAQGFQLDKATWFTKLADPSFISRLKTTKDYVEEKWCDSGFLPVYGTAFDALPCLRHGTAFGYAQPPT